MTYKFKAGDCVKAIKNTVRNDGSIPIDSLGTVYHVEFDQYSQSDLVCVSWDNFTNGHSGGYKIGGMDVNYLYKKDRACWGVLESNNLIIKI